MRYARLFEIYSNYRVEPTEYKCGRIPWTYEPEEHPELFAEGGKLMDEKNIDTWIEHKRERNPGMMICELTPSVIERYGLDIAFERILGAPEQLYVCLRTDDAGKPTYTYFFGVSVDTGK